MQENNYFLKSNKNVGTNILILKCILKVFGGNNNKKISKLLHCTIMSFIYIRYRYIEIEPEGPNCEHRPKYEPKN